MDETKHTEIWHSEEVAWEMKGKMNPTEVASVGRGGWCAGHVLIYFQKLLPDYLPLSAPFSMLWMKMKDNRSWARDLIA